jgi:Lar family restriction alleviation protein
VSLKPCPFCGSTEKDSVDPDADIPCVALHSWPHATYCVQCESCNCSGPLTKTPESAVEAWNKRAKETTP